MCPISSTALVLNHPRTPAPGLGSPEANLATRTAGADTVRTWSWTTRTGQLAPEITVCVPVPVPRRAEDCDEQRASKTLHPAYTFPCVERRTGLDSPSFLDERCLRLWVRTPAGSPSRQFPTALLYSHHPLIYTLARKIAQAPVRPACDSSLLDPGSTPYSPSLALPSHSAPSNYPMPKAPTTSARPALRRNQVRFLHPTPLSPPNHTPLRRIAVRPASPAESGNSYVHSIAYLKCPLTPANA